MDVITFENIQKLMDLGFSKQDVIKALTFKKSVPLAAHWLNANQAQSFVSKESSSNGSSFQASQAEPQKAFDQPTRFHEPDLSVQINRPRNTENIDISHYFEGEIKFLDNDKKYGFINFDEADIFFHYNDKSDKNEDLMLGDSVLFNIGENINKGKNMGRLCAKSVRLKNHRAIFEINSAKRSGTVVEKSYSENFGFVKDKATEKVYIYYFDDHVDHHRFNLGDDVLFFLEMHKKNNISTTNATQLELIPKTIIHPRPTRGKTADLSKNFFYRYDIYPDDESRSVEFKALTKTNSVVQRVLDITEKYLVAFLNAEGGKTFCGILDNGTIIGIKLPRQMRDEIRLGIDSLVAQIRPAVPNDLYRVVFYPVFERKEHIEDYFVLCVECKKGNDIYVDSKHNAWIRRDGSVRNMSISMAKVLWQNRHDESQIKAQFGSNSLEELIKKAISSELKKVVGVNKVLVRDSNKNPIVINDDSDMRINLDCSVKNERKPQKTKDLIDLDKLDEFESLNSFGDDGVLLLDSPFDKPMSKNKAKTANDPVKETPPTNNTHFNSKIVDILLGEGFVLSELLEALYLTEKENPKAGHAELLQKTRGRLAKSRTPQRTAGKEPKRMADETESDGDDGLQNLESMIDDTLRAYNVAEEKHPNNADADWESLFQRSSTRRRNEADESEESEGDVGISDGAESDAARAAKKPRAAARPVAESQGGLFGYINYQQSIARKTAGGDRGFFRDFWPKEPEAEKPKTISREEFVFNEKVADASQDNGKSFTEERIYDLNELVYPLLSKLFSKETGFKKTLDSFLRHVANSNGGGDIIFPSYKTHYHQKSYKSLLKFKIDKTDFFFLADGFRKYELAEEIVAKKALCELEDKSILFLYDQSKDCHFCGLPIPAHNFERHASLCETYIEKQKAAFSMFETEAPPKNK